MAKTYSLEEQLEVMSPQDRAALKEALLQIKAEEEAKESGVSKNRILGNTISRGFLGFGEGALLGLQGRPLSEGVITGAKPKEPDKYEELLKTENLKNLVDPSRRMALREEEEIKRKLAEQVGELRGQEVDSGTESNSDNPPPLKIWTGEYDKNGVKVFGDNPAVELWKKNKENEETNKKKSQMVKDSAKDSLNTITEIEKRMGSFGIFGDLPSMPGSERKNWEANIDKLLSQKIIDVMASMKEASKTGATGFGQLSNKELEVLKNASTQLKKSLSPQDAQRYLNQIKNTLNKVAGDGGDSVNQNTQSPKSYSITPEQAIEELKRRGKM